MKKPKQRHSQTDTSISTTRRWSGWHLVMLDCLFYIMVFVYIWQGIGTHLIFHGGGVISNYPAFYTTWDFFEHNLSQLGGVTLYVSAFLSQLFYHAWLGAIVVTAQAWLFGTCLAYLLHSVRVKLWRLFRFVPAYLLLTIYGQYHYYVPTTMALGLALMCACLYVACARQKWAVRLAFFVVLSVICYAATGGAFMVCVCVCVFYEAIRNRQLVMAGMLALVGLVLPYGLGMFLWNVDSIEAYTRLLPTSWVLQDFESRSQGIEIVYALYVLIPIMLVLGKLMPWQGLNLWMARPGIRSILHWVISVAIAMGVAWNSFDTDRKARFELDYSAAHKMWPEVIKNAHKQPNDDYALHALSRALYHCQRLGHDLFKYPQKPGALFLENKPEKRVFWANYAACMEMGLLNRAEHALTECLEGLGDRPIILKHLALINLAKGNLGTARVYLGALSKTLFHRSWACESLARLKSDPALTSDRDVQYLRSVALDNDIPTVQYSPDKMLGMLLKKNPKNRMAFEYLMTYYMLNHKLVSFAQHIAWAVNVGYSALPTHFEEAALVYVYTKRKSINLEGLKPNVKLRKNIEQFGQIVKRHQGNAQAAKYDLARHFQNTYFFYNMYGPRPRRPIGVAQ